MTLPDYRPTRRRALLAGLLMSGSAILVILFRAGVI